MANSQKPQGERLQKVLAAAGLGSRRECEELIAQGRVYVDGQKVTEMGVRVVPDEQKITCDGEAIHQEKKVYFAVNKPKGYVCTNSDPERRPRVIDLLGNIAQRVYTIGRLDIESEGLILVTNDGELAQRLSHPRYAVDRRYRVDVPGRVSKSRVDELLQGVWLSDGKTKPVTARVMKSKAEVSTLELTLREGKNREVRRMLAKVGLKTKRLIRIQFGPIHLNLLRPGRHRKLDIEEILKLKQAARLIEAPQRKKKVSRSARKTVKKR